MELMLAGVVGVLFGTGTYLMMRPNLVRVIIGLVLLGHGSNLLLLSGGGYSQDAPPILNGAAGSMADPLPQALVLTAIVIGFAVTAFLLVLAYRYYQEHLDVGEEDANLPESEARANRGRGGDGRAAGHGTASHNTSEGAPC